MSDRCPLGYLLDKCVIRKGLIVRISGIKIMLIFYEMFMCAGVFFDG